MEFLNANEDEDTSLAVVMAGLSASEDARERAYVPAIHDLLRKKKTWMPGTRPGMTTDRSADRLSLRYE
jgi:hypothetical protein